MEKNCVEDSEKKTIEVEEQKDYSKYTYEMVMKMIEDTQNSCKKTLDSCSQTINTIGESMKAINETKNNIDGFFDSYGQAMNSLCEKISGAFLGMTHCFKKNQNTDEQFEDSKEVTIDECVKLFKDKKKIVFLTGAGISVASGIPTFRGIGASPLFCKDGITYQNEEISTYNFMKNKPDIFWERNLIFLEGQKGKKHNISHTKIQQLINQYKEIKLNSKNNDYQPQAVIVTQNTDGLHCQAFNEMNPKNTSYMNKGDPQYGYCPDVFEVHGSKRFLRCDNQECSEYQKKFEYPEKYNSYKDFICKECKTQARPHVLYFDESYDEQNYRITTLNNLIADMDILVCVGTQLETGYAARTVSDAVQRKLQVIEVSLTPVIEKGGLTLKGKAEDILPKLCDKIQEMNKQLYLSNKTIQPLSKPSSVKNLSTSSKTILPSQQKVNTINSSVKTSAQTTQAQKRSSIGSTSSVTSTNSSTSKTTTTTKISSTSSSLGPKKTIQSNNKNLTKLNNNEKK